MTKSLLTTALSLSVLIGFTGCGSGRPDPRANPDFNHEAAANPGAVKMGPSSNVNGAPKAKK